MPAPAPEPVPAAPVATTAVPVSALERLTGDPEAFGRAWPEEPVVYARRPAELAALLDAAAVRRIAAEPALRPVAMGMVREGVIDPRRPDPDDPTSTLVLHGLHLTWPPLTAFCAQLVAQLGHPVTANAYRTPRRARGHGPHRDTHHLFFAQTHGAKVWRLSGPLRADPPGGDPWTAVGRTSQRLSRAADMPDLEVELTAGNVLFVPRGWAHHGYTGSRSSLHITFGVQAPTRFRLVQQLLRHAMSDPRLRAAFPPGPAGAGPDALAAQGPGR